MDGEGQGEGYGIKDKVKGKDNCWGEHTRRGKSEVRNVVGQGQV